MNSSNKNCNYNNPIIYFPENDINNSTSKLDDPCSYSLFNFPNSPQYSNMEYDLHQIYHHLLSDPTENENPPEENPTKPIRSSKKDRHSKINTARGPRDRRMRLSLDVAQKFFDLQDMLGYDKASRTVDWLLKKSSRAISDLEKDRNMGANYGSSTNSDSCDQDVVSSGLDNLSGVWENDQRSSAKQIKKKKVKKVLTRPIVEKESRKKARERARVRASQKRRLLSGTADDQHTPCGESDNHYEENLMVIINSRERDEIFDDSMSFQVPWNYPSTASNPHDDGILHPHHLAEFSFVANHGRLKTVVTNQFN